MSSTLKIIIDPTREGRHDYARIIETYWTIDGPRSRLTDRTFPSMEEAKKELTELRLNMPGTDEPDEFVSRIMLQTTDPDHALRGQPLPAMTTLLYRVCDNDGPKFDEACRLIALFIEKAIILAKAAQ